MNRSCRAAVAALLLVLASAMTLSAQEAAPDPLPAYLFSTLVGYGTGHFYLQDPSAMKFLLLEAGALAAGIGGVVVTSLYATNSASGSASNTVGMSVGLSVAIAGALAYSSFRIWEIVDVIRAVNEQRAVGKVAIRPAMGLVGLGIALSY